MKNYKVKKSYCHKPTVWYIYSEELTQFNQRKLVTIMENHAIYKSFTKQGIFNIRYHSIVRPRPKVMGGMFDRW